MDISNSNTIPNNNSTPLPAANGNALLASVPAAAHPNILFTGRTATALITHITKYLSTLPHPIEVVEELVAVIAVTGSLLTSLHSTLSRFPHLQLSQTHSFIGPLCHDILFAFKQFENRVQEARRMKVFEPNDVGLVRVPRCAWTLVLGTEAKVAALRSRLYVEKYRVRVLIEAVTWQGLRTLQTRSARENEELRGLQKMLPLVAERLIGVQKDYRPRLLRLQGFCGQVLREPEVVIRAPHVVVAMPTSGAVATAHSIPAPQHKDEFKKPHDEKMGLKPSESKLSLASTRSSITTVDRSTLESWVLRANRPHRPTITSTRLFGVLPILSTRRSSPSTYYVKPVLASAAETTTTIAQCYSAPNKRTDYVRRTILKMPADAQWEIRKLLEARETACSNKNTKSTWEVLEIMQRARRVAAPEPVRPVVGAKKWWQRRKRECEWVLVLKGEVVEEKERVMPGRQVDPWAVKPAPAPVVAAPAPPAAAPVARPQQVQGTVLRHVENRRVLSVEEAEAKMLEIISQLFISDPPAPDTRSETEVEDSDEEDEDEEEDADEEEGELEWLYTSTTSYGARVSRDQMAALRCGM